MRNILSAFAQISKDFPYGDYDEDYGEFFEEEGWFPWLVDEDGFPITPGVHIEETSSRNHSLFLFFAKKQEPLNT